VELLNAQAALADARTERTRSLAEWHSARLRLLAAAGVLDSADL
jgi:outer membrane protein